MALSRGEDEPGELVDDAYVIGIDLGGTYIWGVLADERDALVERRRKGTLAKEGESAVLDRITGMVENLSSDAPRVAAVGIASPEPLNAKTGVVYSPPAFPDWHDVPLAWIMHERTGLPVFLGNDANVAALGEFDYGAGRGFRHLIYITVSTGIGGVIVDGKLLEGQKGAAGEVGHMVMKQDDPPYGCGGHGCLEALALGTAIARQAREALASGRESTIESLPSADGITAEVVAGAAKVGDALKVELIRAAGRRLGCGVIKLVHVFNPRVVVIGGGVTNAGEHLLEPVRETVFAGLMPVLKEDLAIVPPELGTDAGLYGAVVLARRETGVFPGIPDTAKLQGDMFGPQNDAEGAMQTYPIKLTYHVRAYAFGERLIPDMLGKKDVPEGIVAETWEVSDYRDAPAIVKNGPYAGEKLHDLVEEYPDELVGEGWRGPHFPLLEKFLDASHMLPVHLHADDETARRKHGEPHGKTEAWHILWAAPDASILAGVKEGVDPDDLYRAFKAQNYDAVMPRYPIQPGDTVYVPGGVIHSFGPDTLIFEVQQTSDLGQSVMPEDLYGNPLNEETWDANIDAALDELRTDYHPRPNPGLALENGRAVANRRILCCAGPHFALERWILTEPYTESSHPGRCLTLSNVGDSAHIEYAGGTEMLESGESCILPAASGETRIVPEGETNLIVCYVPDLERDVVTPLREAGYSDEEIRELGEVNV